MSGILKIKIIIQIGPVIKRNPKKKKPRTDIIP